MNDRRFPLCGDPRVATLAMTVFFLFTAVVGSANGDELDESEASNPDAKAPTLRIPAQLPDGRVLRPIGLYQGQMDALIPNYYRPVQMDQLSEAVAKLTQRATDDQTSRLKGAVYWIEVAGDTLVSQRSVIDIESDRNGIVRRSLGRVNLAIEPPQSRGTVSAIDVLPRFESEADGNLLAVFQRDENVRSGIEFKWRLRGQTQGSGHEFLLKLPRTPQTRIVLSAPPEVTLQTLDGILRSRIGAPPDASDSEKARDLSWYELDAGGLASVRIRSEAKEANADKGKLVVRRLTVQYDADPSGLAWTSRMVVQVRPDQPLPPLVVSGTTITSIKVNATEVPYTGTKVGDSGTKVQIELPRGLINDQSVSVDVSLMGHSTWNNATGDCNLPVPIWIGDRVIYANATSDVHLAVAEPLQVMSWQLPDDWNQVQQQRVNETTLLYTAEGPPISGAKDAVIASGDDAVDTAWSRVRFVRRPMLDASETALRLNVSARSVNAVARLAIQVDPRRVEPLNLRVQPGWSLDEVTCTHSGRVVEHAGINKNTRRRTLVLWPETADVLNGNIELEISGSMNLDAEQGSAFEVPPIWFIQCGGVRGPLVAAIEPPSDLNWSGEVALLRERVDAAVLTSEQREFFSGLDEDTLFFRPETGRTPAVALQTPSVSFNADTLLEIRRERDEVTEEFVIKIESASQSLKQLTIQTGPSGKRPQLTWYLSGVNETQSTSIPAGDLAERDGVYTIDLSDESLRGKSLIARRRYSLDGPLRIQLPSVSGAASQSAEAILGPGLLLKQKSSTAQLIPYTAAGDSAEQRGHVRLRYDAVEQPSITIAKSLSDPDVTIVWHEQVAVTASSRGTDRIEASYRVSPTAPLEIEFEPEMQLASITRDGQPVDLNAMTPQPNLIVLQPRSATEVVQVVWNRSQFGLSWMRRCRMPRIDVSGTVLKSEYRLISSPDTFIPAALLRGQVASRGSMSWVELRPDASAVLTRRNIALATGWLIALMAFTISWFISRRSPLAIASLVAVSTTILFMWWPWKLAIIGWLIVPVIAGAMLATSRVWGTGRLESSGPSDPSESRSRGSTHGSADFSLGALGRIITLAGVLVGIAAAAAAIAQDPPGPLPGGHAVNVLVPVNSEGKVAGDVVYIPKSVRSELFPSAKASEPKDARFQSANYRADLQTVIALNQRVIRATIVAEYLVHVQDATEATNPVRLPLASASILRIRSLDDGGGIIPFKPDADSGHVVAVFPRGDSFRVQVTSVIEENESDQWTRLKLAVPPVASTRLLIDSERDIDAIRVRGVSGRFSTTLLRSEELGPVDSIDIEARAASYRSASGTRILQRRYRVNAGKKQVAIDCELQPPDSYASGENYEFVIRDFEMPTITSSAWRVESVRQSSPTRRTITVKSTRDSPGPVRLLWTRTIALDRVTDPDSGASIRIPEVLSASSSEKTATWVGLHCDPSLQFATLELDSLEPLSVDQFQAAWSGYRTRVDRAVVALDELPVPVLQQKPVNEPIVSQQHQLHVTSDRLELRYNAILKPSDTVPYRYRIRMPEGLQLVRVAVNAQDLNSRPIATDDHSEVRLGTFFGSDPVMVEVVAVQPYGAKNRFTPPRLTLVPADSSTDAFTILRDRSTKLVKVRAPKLEPMSPSPTSADSLADGWLPESSWSILSNQIATTRDVPGGVFEVQPRSTGFDCDQLIVLKHDDQRWTMETLVRITTKQIPDFIDVEVPTQWCTELEVAPTPAWVSQPATESSRKIIRIRTDPSQLVDGILSITGQLQTSDTGRVSVPLVKVLGFGKRRIHINVPDQLISEPIQWRTSAVEAVSVPSHWQEQMIGGLRSTYAVANPSWSIDLAPLSEVDSRASAASGDIQVFPQETDALLMCHWDVSPGGLESIEVGMPPGSTCLGAWSAGQAVVIENAEAGQLEGSDRYKIKVPLALSRLSQPLELLVRVPAAQYQSNYLPELIGVPVMEEWLTSYVPADSLAADSSMSRLPDQDRAIALAESVVESIESGGTLTQRPRDEVIAWLKPWVTRYRLIAESARHIVDFEVPLEGSEEGDSAGPLSSIEVPYHVRWKELDLRMAAFLTRFLAGDSSSDAVAESAVWFDEADSGELAFKVTDFDGYVPHHVIRLTATNRPRIAQPESSSDRGLRHLIVNVLTILLVCGLLACLMPLQRYATPVVTHPAFWLGLMGVFGFAVAPIPVAATILFLAVSLPASPSRRRS